MVPFFEDYSPTPAFESFEKTRYLDGSIELTYEYDTTDENEPYISATISYEASTQDAAAAYLATWSIQQTGLNVADQNMELKELDSFIRPEIVQDLQTFFTVVSLLDICW